MQEGVYQKRAENIIEQMLMSLDKVESEFKERISEIKRKVADLLASGNLSALARELSSIGSELRRYLSGSYGSTGIDDSLSYLFSDTSAWVKRLNREERSQAI